MLLSLLLLFFISWWFIVYACVFVLNDFESILVWSLIFLFFFSLSSLSVCTMLRAHVLVCHTCTMADQYNCKPIKSSFCKQNLLHVQIAKTKCKMAFAYTLIHTFFIQSTSIVSLDTMFSIRMRTTFSILRHTHTHSYPPRMYGRFGRSYFLICISVNWLKFQMVGLFPLFVSARIVSSRCDRLSMVVTYVLDTHTLNAMYTHLCLFKLCCHFDGCYNWFCPIVKSITIHRLFCGNGPIHGVRLCLRWHNGNDELY